MKPSDADIAIVLNLLSKAKGIPSELGPIGDIQGWLRLASERLDPSIAEYGIKD